MIIISHDYKVVINIHKVIFPHNVKLQFYVWTQQASIPISEGLAEIQIDSQHCKGINLTIQHT
jgi:hypothetical protein